MQDDVISFTEDDYRVSLTLHTSKDLSLQSEPASNTHGQPEPTTTVYTCSEIGSRSVTPVPISFEGCVLWNLRAFMVRTMASAKGKRIGRVCLVEDYTLSVRWKLLDEHVCVQTHCNVRQSQHTCEQYSAHLSCRNNVRFLYCTPKYNNSPGPRPCEAAPQELARPTTTNHMGVPESKACEHDVASLLWQHSRREP